MGDGGESFVEAGVWGVEGAAWCVFDEEVVDGDVEGLGDVDDGVGVGCDFSGFVAADLVGAGGADGLGEVVLGPGSFFAELFEAVAEGHGLSLGVGWFGVVCPFLKVCWGSVGVWVHWFLHEVTIPCKKSCVHV